MGSRELCFEVRFRINGYAKVAHISARDHIQAEKKASKFPHVVWVRKVDPYRVAGNLDYVKLFQEIGQPQKVEGSLYPSAIAMDEFIWQKNEPRFKDAVKVNEMIENNRIRRVEDKKKDKNPIDKVS